MAWAIGRQTTGEGSEMSTKSGGRQGSHGQRNKGNRTPFPLLIQGRLLRRVGMLRVAFAVVTCAFFGVEEFSLPAL